MGCNKKSPQPPNPKPSMSEAAVKVTKGILFVCAAFTAVTFGMNMTGRKVPFISDFTTHPWKRKSEQ